jgi:two-component system response regulator FlrC
VIATTNRDLEAWVKKGQFREDLYYRLNVINLTLPPLRERPGDVELLTRTFLNRFGEDYGRAAGISEAALEWLKRQEWPGNVRELRNTVERAVLLSSGPLLEIRDFSPPEEKRVEPDRAEPDSSSLCLREMEQRMISRALEKTGGNRTHAARILGISIRTLRNKLNEYKQGVSAGETP